MPRRRATGLSGRDKAVIDLEREWGQAPGAQEYKLEAAQRDLGLSTSGYALVLRALVDDPLAYEYDRETLTRLRSMRTLRATLPSAGPAL